MLLNNEDLVRERWDNVEAFLEYVFNVNPPNPANKYKTQVLVFMLTTLREYSYYYKETVESHLSDLQDKNEDQGNIDYFQKLYDQWIGLEKALNNIDTIIDDLQNVNA
jgi:hypothetical protein